MTYGQVLITLVVVVAFPAATLVTDHYNCKQRKRKALLGQLKRTTPLTHDEVDSWAPVWTMFVPAKWVKR